ncbi:MAG: PEGA domain-containing protein, partial [Pontiellaceae bacterium]|nr:PEGA domain-containing protein [Pontiellaceae bacterium]
GKKVSMEARAPRYYSQKIDVTPESAKQVRIDLKAMPYVMIKSQPSGAQVFIKGTLVGVTPIEQLIEKETQIELKNDGYISKTEVLTGKDKAVDISLEKIPPPPPPVVANTNLTESSDSELVEDVVPAKKETADESVSGKGILFAIIGATVLAVVVFFVMKRKS